MEWLDTEAKILDKLQVLLFNGGHPLQVGYLSGYASLFVNAYRLGSPKGEHIFEVMRERGAMENHHAEINVPALCEAWTHWWALMDDGLKRQMLTLGPRGPYDDFAAPPK